MDRLLWNAAHRLAWLVVLALVTVGVPLVHDALLHRANLVADVSAGSAVCLAAGALFAILRARRFFAFFGRDEDGPRLPFGPYRRNAVIPKEDPYEPERARATRCAAGALVALAVAGSFVIVAAASR